MAFIGFGKINKNIIPLILGCVFCLLNRLLNTYNVEALFKNVILTNIFIALAHTLIIIPFIVYKIANKICWKNQKNKEGNRNNSASEKVDETKKSKYIYSGDAIENAKRKYLFIFLTGIIFFANFYLFIFTIQVKSNTWTIYIVFTSLFYYLIFKSKLYRHHYLSICLILIFSIIIDLVIGNLKSDFENELLKFFLSIIRLLILSLNYVLIKYTMEKKYVSPYIIGMFIALINLTLFIIFGILDHFCFHFNNYVEYFQNFSSEQLLLILGLMSTQLGIYTCLFFIDKNDTPCHIFIVFCFGQFSYIFKNLKDKSPGKIAVIIIFLILILFFSLVFNEIIELRFLGLAYNTKKNISERGVIEVDNAMILTNLTDNKSEDSIEMLNKSIEQN